MPRSAAHAKKPRIGEPGADGDAGAVAAHTAFYAFLEVAPTASADEIRKAYQRKALRCHPDKNLQRKDEATAEFQRLAHIYAVLSDPPKRAYYDKFGESAEQLADLEDASAIYEAVMDYIKGIPRVTETKLADFFDALEQHRRAGTLSASETGEVDRLVVELIDQEEAILAHCAIHMPGFERKPDTPRFRAYLRRGKAATQAPTEDGSPSSLQSRRAGAKKAAAQ